MFQACRKPPTSAVLVLTIIILEALIVCQLQLMKVSNDIEVKVRVSCCTKVLWLYDDLKIFSSLSSDAIKGSVKNGGPLNAPWICPCNYS